jgi:hypothetical protein
MSPSGCLLGVSGSLSVRPAPAGSAMSAGGGGPRPLLAILRGNQAPGQIARREQNPTEVSGVDALIDVGG